MGGGGLDRGGEKHFGTYASFRITICKVGLITPHLGSN